MTADFALSILKLSSKLFPSILSSSKLLLVIPNPLLDPTKLFTDLGVDTPDFQVSLTGFPPSKLLPWILIPSTFLVSGISRRLVNFQYDQFEFVLLAVFGLAWLVLGLGDFFGVRLWAGARQNWLKSFWVWIFSGVFCWGFFLAYQVKVCW